MSEKPVIYNAENSTFTLLVYFKDGYTKGMKFHSGKQETRRYGGHEITDHRYALNRLVSLIEGSFSDKYKTAMIYHNPTGCEIMRYAYGVIKSKELIKWSYQDDGSCIFKFNDKQQTPDALRERLKEMHTEMKFKF